ncbi:MAG TPA: ABC-F family ATP-binding cassette domain-containing protein [Actinocrinis sp.]|uniref:ribosomal protection-like ABC-F family protein n=1 Tax=Actinocrinis sp. TaxID=1920516 RepID=UPI002DDDAD92|nr:ABC-F family ATP-binding cassette domain-containing protein [Actinocrinis sp.]HEV2344017.1 ABC-F family ATP-binding cassette domain-containing protein [Actinocrinis sp.]
MANLVNIEAVSKAYGTRALLDGVSLGIAEGDRIGVVGRNGGGKSTLVRLLAKAEEPDRGRVTHTGSVHVNVVGQHDELDPTATIREQVLSGMAEHEWAGQAHVRDVLTGLLGGINAPAFSNGLDTVVAPLSGGERRRIALAKALLEPDDTDRLLLLDEPTNHLDVEAIAWLASHLKSRRSALLVVTHDRWFLDEVCSQTWEVTRGEVHAYEGGYSAYVLARAERARVASADWDRKQNLLRKELAWLRRGAPARTSKPKFRIEAANALIAAEPPPRDDAELMRFATARLGRTVYEFEDVTYRVGVTETGTGTGIEIGTGPDGAPSGALGRTPSHTSGRTLLDHVTWQLAPGERLGLVGVNGSGKTSLLRLLTGAVVPDSGKVVTGVTAKPALLAQEITEIPATKRVREAVEEVRSEVDLGKGRTLTGSQLLDRFGFTGEKQWTPVGDLSGGERRRLQVLRLLMAEPNVLLLDEPTNDLDIDTLTALEDLLDSWPGSMIVVSHDRYFLERTTDRIAALLGDGKLRMLPGGVDQYLQRRAEILVTTQAQAAQITRSAQAQAAHATRSAQTAHSMQTTQAAQTTQTAQSGSAAASGLADRPASSSRDQRAAQKEMARIERQLDKISARESDLHDRMAQAAADYAEVGRLDAELRDLSAERDRLEEQWLALAE